MYVLYFGWLAGCLTTLDTADKEPDKDPPGTEEADNEVEKMVSGVVLVDYSRVGLFKQEECSNKEAFYIALLMHLFGHNVTS